MLTNSPEAPSPNPEQNVTAAPQYRRRIWIVDKRMQFMYMLQLIIGVLGGIGAVALTVWMLRGRYKTEAEFMASLPRIAIEVLLFVIFVVIPIVGMIISHRIAGPAYRLRQSMKRIMEDDLGFRVKLRTGDYMKETANVFNEMLEHLESKAKQETLDREHMIDTLESAAEKLKDPGHSEFPEALRLIEETIAHLKK